MSDIIEKKIQDNWQEHILHTAYDPKCSTCYSENRIIQAKKTVVSNERALRNPYGDNYPTGYNPNYYE